MGLYIFWASAWVNSAALRNPGDHSMKTDAISTRFMASLHMSGGTGDRSSSWAPLRSAQLFNLLQGQRGENASDERKKGTPYEAQRRSRWWPPLARALFADSAFFEEPAESYFRGRTLLCSCPSACRDPESRWCDSNNLRTS